MENESNLSPEVQAHLNRFLIPQETDYERALSEVRAGKKVTHWIWYIFPQMKGLGRSQRSHYYGIDNREEAKAYIAHPVLRQRLVEIAQAVLDSEHSVYHIFGPDAVKVRSCILLFASVCDIPVFHQLKARYCW